MTGMQLFESLQYLDDALLEETPARSAAPRRRWRGWGLAACLALTVGAAALLYLPAPVMNGRTEPGTASPEQAAGTAETARPVEPGGVPGPGAAPDAAPVPDVLAWNEVDETRRSIASDVAGKMMVAEPLTEAQRAACSPEIKLEWMGDFDGFADYYLKDGAGGLAYIEMTVTHPGVGSYTVRLRDADSPEPPSCLSTVRETDSVGSFNGQAYRAYRLHYLHGEGDPRENPPEAWTEMQVVFEREGVVYTLTAAVPQVLEDAAATDLRDLLLAYAGTHAVPDLSAFRCGEYLYRDDTLTLPEALSDPDFGAYLPAEGPEGFKFDFARRYQFEEVADYLLAFWTFGRADLQWLIQPVTAEAQSRVVSPEERERFDWNLYPVPWSAYAKQEDWAAVENPVFRIGDLSMELIAARVHTGDEGQSMFRLGVLYDSGVLVEVDARDVPPAWVYEALTQIQ